MEADLHRLTRLLSTITLFMAACSTQSTGANPALSPTGVPPTLPASATASTPTTSAPTEMSVPPSPESTSASLVPDFTHILIFLFESKEFSTVIGNPRMPIFNQLARENTLLTQHFAIRHPSLPNYLALIGGDTFGITSDCEDCFIDEPSLPDLIEKAGLTWKTYQENMPKPCFVGSTLSYAQKHNPFVYFDPVRLDKSRCERSVLPLSALKDDLTTGSLPNYAFVMPNMCNSAHDCGLDTADAWLKIWNDRLINQPSMAANSLIILTWDEGQGQHTCCGLKTGGGRIATVLISDKAKKGFQDETPYTHYSILRTISTAWNLPLLGHAADAETTLITAPWITP